jgi:hypothetical protein
MALAPLESRLALYYPSPLYPGEPDGAHNWMGINVARILNCLTSDQCTSSGTLGGGTSEGAEEQEQVAVASASVPVHVPGSEGFSETATKPPPNHTKK